MYSESFANSSFSATSHIYTRGIMFVLLLPQVTREDDVDPDNMTYEVKSIIKHHKGVGNLVKSWKIARLYCILALYSFDT